MASSTQNSKFTLTHGKHLYYGMGHCGLADANDAQEHKPRRMENSRAHHQKANTLDYKDYTVGWICALPKELTAAQAMLDKEHGKLAALEGDSNAYMFGSIGPHNVVIACLPISVYGIAPAASVATNMRRTFPNLRLRLLVGIGGGVPQPEPINLRLGDVVVGVEIKQYDLGKRISKSQFVVKDMAEHAHRDLSTHLALLQARHGSLGGSKMPRILGAMIQNLPAHARPCGCTDPLRRPEYMDRSEVLHSASCTIASARKRQPPENDDAPNIHYGIIASGNQVIKDNLTRDEIATSLKAICFDMEAAGLLGQFPCLVIRGISDYADSNKNDLWQGFAAAAAAAYAKELLLEIPGLERSDAIAGHATNGASGTPPVRGVVLGNAYQGHERLGMRLFSACYADFFFGSNIFVDPASVVDVMKSFGLDSSFEGRCRYAREHGISGNPGSGSWNMKIRRHVLQRYGRLG